MCFCLCKMTCMQKNYVDFLTREENNYFHIKFICKWKFLFYKTTKETDLKDTKIKTYLIKMQNHSLNNKVFGYL